jgi:Holliday junction resolvase RusA-like endonuclease
MLLAVVQGAAMIRIRNKQRMRIDREARAFPLDGCYHRFDGDTLEMLLPWPPSNNVCYRHYMDPTRRKVRTTVSRDGAEFTKQVRFLLGGVHSFGTARLRVRVILHGPTDQRRDVKNFDKALCDAIQRDERHNFRGVYNDDSQIDDFRVVRGHKKPDGKVHVFVREIPPVLPDWIPARLFQD